MILVDTSVWIDHLRAEDTHLTDLLYTNQVLIHPMVVGELACGNLRNRKEVLALISDLPGVPTATHAEVLFFIEQHQLMGRGISYIDTHLLAATALSEPAQLWTRDKRLLNIAATLNLAYNV